MLAASLIILDLDVILFSLFADIHIDCIIWIFHVCITLNKSFISYYEFEKFSFKFLHWPKINSSISFGKGDEKKYWKQFKDFTSNRAIRSNGFFGLAKESCMIVQIQKFKTYKNLRFFARRNNNFIRSIHFNENSIWMYIITK